MALTLVPITCPTDDGEGAAVDVSALGRDKAIAITGTYTANATISIEASGFAAGDDWVPILTVRRAGLYKLGVAAMRMRCVVSAYDGHTAFAPDVDVAAEEADAAVTGELVATAGNGTGASVDLSEMPDWRTIYVTDFFSGSVQIEGSQDGTNFSPSAVASFTQPGQITLRSPVRYYRVTRAGFDSNLPGTPIISVVGMLTAGAPIEFGTDVQPINDISSVGTSELVARVDHRHAHGDMGEGNFLHVFAGYSTGLGGIDNDPSVNYAGNAGFLVGTDKRKLDLLYPSPVGEDLEVVASDGTPGEYANGVSYIELTAAQYIAFQFVSSFTGHIEITFRYSMSAANGGTVTWARSFVSIGDGVDPNTATATGATFTVTPGNDVLSHRVAYADSTTLRIAVTRGNLVYGRITRIGGTHTGNPRVTQVQVRERYLAA